MSAFFIVVGLAGNSNAASPAPSPKDSGVDASILDDITFMLSDEEMKALEMSSPEERKALGPPTDHQDNWLTVEELDAQLSEDQMKRSFFEDHTINGYIDEAKEGMIEFENVLVTSSTPSSDKDIAAAATKDDNANISEIQEAATQNKGNSSLFPEEHQAQAKQPPSAVDTGAPETAPPALKSLNRLKNGFKNRFSQGFEHFKGVVGVSPRAPNVCTTNDRGEEVTEDDDHSTATRRFSNRESIVPARFTYD